MRIAYLTNVYARASDTFIRNEVVELRARGHVVETFSIRRTQETASFGPEVAAEQATTCYILDTPKPSLVATIVATAVTHPLAVGRAFATAMRLSPGGFRARAMHTFYWLEAVFLASRLRQNRIDVLHNHIAENSATVALLASEITSIPFSMTVHGPGIFFHPEEWSLGEKVARAAFTACISDFCRSQVMLFSALAHWPKLQVVRCGVGRAFEARPPQPPPDAPRLLFVGRLCEEKGLPLLLDAVERFRRKGGRCMLAIVGDGPLRAYVVDFIARHDLGDTVELLGWRDSAAIADELARSRALVLPSLAEGLPVVIMEALALGRPVVTTSIAGIPELVRDGENGWLTAAGSVDGLIEAIAAVVSSTPEQLMAMGRSGARAVRERHCLDTEIPKLEAHLTAAAATGRRGRRGLPTVDPVARPIDS